MTATPADLPPLPPKGLRLLGDTDEGFVEIGTRSVKILERFGLRPDDTILDVGCSVGRVPIALMHGGRFHGKYIGFDVTPKHVKWCANALTPFNPSYRFEFVDVYNSRYNPDGKVKPSDLTFPAKSNSIDMAFLFSIFTHFYLEDIEVYLRELFRTTKPGGTVVATWFTYTAETLEGAKTSGHYPMTFRHDEHTIYMVEEDPLRAIAFDEAKTREVILASGFEIETLELGTWSGTPGSYLQDIFVLRKPAATGFLARLRSRLGR